MYIAGIDPTETYSDITSLTYGVFGGVGQRGMDNLGNEYIFCLADEDLTQYAACVVNEDYEVEMVDTTSTAPGTGQGKVVCVPQVAVTDTYYFWGLVNGVSSVLGAASCVKFTNLNSTAVAGTLDDDATSGAELITGIVFDTTLTSAAATSAVINHPVVGATLA